MINLWLWTLAALILTPLHATSSDTETSAALDVAIVIDRTRSIGPANYDRMLNSVRKFISKFDVGENTTHFAIVTYAGNAEIRVNLTDTKYYSQEALNQLIQEMKRKDRLSMPTRTDKAIRMVCEHVFVPQNGDRPESPNVMILLTDGHTHVSSEPYDTVIAGCKVTHVHRVAVGVGRNIKLSELEVITGDKNQVIMVENFRTLNNHLDNIRQIANDVNGGYTAWSEWPNCPKTCGGGLRERLRNCTNPKPRNNGKTCAEQNLGLAYETEYCNIQDCPIAGNFTKWSEWGECSATCGGGVQKRKRTCTNPPPSSGGSNCTEQNLGPTEDQQECNTQGCPISGNFTKWSEWGECNVTCGGGVQKRNRTCTNPPPSSGGLNCTEENLGPAEEEQECNKQDCVLPVDPFGPVSSDPSPPKPCKEHLDIGLIIDSSDRISTADYDIIRRYLIQLAERLEISEAGTHMAILLYSWEAHIWHRFSDNQTIAAIKSKAYSLPHIRGGTRTDRALQLAAEDLFGWEDSGDRPDKPNFLVVLTYGDTYEGSQPFGQVIPPLDEAKVRRLVIGIGHTVVDEDLRQIASTSSYVLQVSGFSDLYTKLEEVMKLACNQQHLGDCGNWESYGACSKTCGGGVQVRTRTCPENSLHLKKQKKHCNTNLCPGQKLCKDKEENCPIRAASGDCWKTAQPSAKFYVGKKFPLWVVCPKSCRRCNVDPCQDSDPYVCPWWSNAKENKRKCRFIFASRGRIGILKEMCQKSCRQCPAKGDCMDSSPRCYSVVRSRGCRSRRVKETCKKSCGLCGGGSPVGYNGNDVWPNSRGNRRPGDIVHGDMYPWGR